MKNKFFCQRNATICSNQIWNYDYTDEIPEYDICKAKASAILAYLFFFIPLVFDDDQQFARFHSNQSLLNLLLSTIAATALSFIPYVGLPLLVFVELMCLFNAIRGMILAARGKAIGIPIIGWVTILSYRRV